MVRTRAAMAEDVAFLKADGLNGIQIAERLGISRSYAYELLSDPEGHEVRARKDSYRGTCEVCGARTDGSNGRRAPSICTDCRHQRDHDERRWTPEACVEAMRAWAERHGRAPKSQPDWVTAAEDHPSSATVVRELGWNECLRRAGLPVTHHSHTAQHLTNDMLVVLYACGLSCDEIAKGYNVGTGTNVSQRIKRHGGVTFRQTLRRLSDREVEVACRMYAGGLTCAEIAEFLDSSYSTVLRRLKAAGVELRRPGQRATADGGLMVRFRVSLALASDDAL